MSFFQNINIYNRINKSVQRSINVGSNTLHYIKKHVNHLGPIASSLFKQGLNLNQ